MKRVLIKATVAVFMTAILSAFNSAFSQKITMTLETNSDKEVSFNIGGVISVVIDWGDGTIIEYEYAKRLNVYDDSGDPIPYEYKHKYSTASSRTITITGKNITDFDCEGNQLTSLNVSKNKSMKVLDCRNNQLKSLNVKKNKALTVLWFADNQLTNLDVSKNKALLELDCKNNQLKSLDVGKNTALKWLNCGNNQLTTLDVKKNTALLALLCNNNQLMSLDAGKNTALTWLNCSNNQFSAAALNTLFETLHSNDIEEKYYGKKEILISDNPETDACNKNIAENKGWKVK